MWQAPKVLSHVEVRSAMRKGIIAIIVLSLLAPSLGGCLVAAAGGAGYVVGKHHGKKQEERKQESRD
jgi:hypothetical protein